MAQYLAEEHLNSEGELDKKTRSALRPPPKKRLYKKKAEVVVEQGDDADSSNDSDFESILSDTDSSSNDITDNEPLTNAEVGSVYVTTCTL
jgi:hypothetical protein